MKKKDIEELQVELHDELIEKELLDDVKMYHILLTTRHTGL